mmetsp:Transcript_6813/g.13514  ORF Transcript_6813/g.13514 Transcript_6813/m.13514 type:complete len:107 (+) Transcript_6813:367-687(+)
MRLDRRAIDTVTNFTTTAEDFRGMGCRRVLVVTSTFHMLRAKAIAMVVFGGTGIASEFEPCDRSVADPAPREGWVRVVRDFVRGWLWLLFGIDGRWLARLRHPHRN